MVNKVTTYGQKAVGLSFNPSGDDAVASCKQGFANEIDRMHSLRNTTESNEQKLLASVAITEMQGCPDVGRKGINLERLIQYPLFS